MTTPINTNSYAYRYNTSKSFIRRWADIAVALGERTVTVNQIGRKTWGIGFVQLDWLSAEGLIEYKIERGVPVSSRDALGPFDCFADLVVISKLH